MCNSIKNGKRFADTKILLRPNLCLREALFVEYKVDTRQVLELRNNLTVINENETACMIRKYKSVIVKKIF